MQNIGYHLGYEEPMATAARQMWSALVLPYVCSTHKEHFKDIEFSLTHPKSMQLC